MQYPKPIEDLIHTLSYLPGTRSKNAMVQLIRRGYTNLYDLGMLNFWDGPVEWADDDVEE